MVVIQKGRIGKKSTGGIFKAARKKRKFEIGRAPILTGIGKHKITVIKTKGGGRKAKVLRTDVLNLYDPKTKKYTKSKIKIVVENKANRNYVRRNIITKGAVVETESGKAKVTSRPGQDGTVNGILIS